MRPLAAVSLLALAAATPGLAAKEGGQPAPAGSGSATGAPPVTDADVDAIVVTAERLRGQVQTASAPVLELDQQQVAAYGATSIADLVAQLAPQIGSGRGRGGQPVILVNGQRISNFREIGRYPPESIKRVEVLPEEVALKFGFPADQRVINFILQDNFVSREAEIERGAPSRGGYSSDEGEAGVLKINGTNRLNASANYQRTSALTEAERGIVQPSGSVPTVATDPNPAAYRTLVPRSEQFEANVTNTRGLGEDGSDGQITLNSQWIHSVSQSLAGLDLARSTDASGNPVIRVIDTDPIAQHVNTDALSLGGGYSRRLAGGYQFQTTFDGGLTDTETLIDRRRTAPGPVIADLARSKVWSAGVKSTLIGTPYELPAGGLGVTLTSGFDWDRVESFDTRSPLGNAELTRGDLSAGANITVPVASRRNDVLAALGDLTFTLGGGVDRLSDFGTLGNVTAGTIWKPVRTLTLQATYTARDAAPGLLQLGAPTIQTFNVPVFDFRTGQTVQVTQTAGGNRDLRAETQRDWKLSANYELNFLDNSSILVEYYRNRSNDVTSSFPLLTPQIEAAFPGRVTRDVTGRLIALDTRPVTFAETRADRLRYGINLSGRIGKPLPPGARGGGFGGMMGGMRAAERPPGSAGPVTTPLSGPPAPGSAPGSAPAGQTGFDPQRFAELREKFCATPPGTVPDLSALPPQMLARLKGEDGKIDPARVAVLRDRFCSGDAARRFDPARFAAMRQALCADPAKAPDPAAIPEEVRNRLKGPDGTIAPERLKEFQTRICALPAGVSQDGGRGESRGNDADARPAEGDGVRSGGTSGRSGGGGFGPGGDGRGRWNLALYHTVNLSNSVLVSPGGPFLNLIDGDATGSSGGVPRHQFEMEGGGFYRGFGLRLSATYTGATTVRGTGLPGSTDLRFGSLALFNLRTFIALDQQKWLAGDSPGFLKQARMSLRINNIFDARQRVTDGNGVVPLRYQPFLVDPVGRFVEIEFRKLF